MNWISPYNYFIKYTNNVPKLEMIERFYIDRWDLTDARFVMCKERYFRTIPRSFGHLFVRAT